VVHLADQRRYGVGVVGYEVGSGYLRQEPLQRIAHRPLARLVDTVQQSAHLAVLHGRDVLYLIEERAPGRPPLVSDVGVRLPAHLTASGRAILAALPSAQVRALYPDRSTFVVRHGAGPTSLRALRALLVRTGADHPRRGQHRRRRDMGRGDPGGARATHRRPRARLGTVVTHLATPDPGTARDPGARDRPRGPHPARRGRPQPGRLSLRCRRPPSGDRRLRSDRAAAGRHPGARSRAKWVVRRNSKPR
jgi:hypothetical protein